jgi:hypothetical protein
VADRRCTEAVAVRTDEFRRAFLDLARTAVQYYEEGRS